MEKTINQKLLEFQKNVTKIKKDATNPYFKSRYASLGNILEEIKPLLNEFGLVLTQPIINNEVFTIITCIDTDKAITSGIVLPTGLKAQDIGSAITYYRRYTLSSLLSLEIDEDDDGNKATKKAETKPLDDNKESDKIWLNPNTGIWTKAVEAMKTGTSLDKIKTKYALSTKNEVDFLKQVNGK